MAPKKMSAMQAMAGAKPVAAKVPMPKKGSSAAGPAPMAPRPAGHTDPHGSGAGATLAPPQGPKAGFLPPGACQHSRERRNVFVNEFEPHFHVPRRLQKIPTPLVEAVNDFHFAMMNDKPRNEFYWELLRRNVTPESGVLEIGAGSGLLSMMAAKLGAKWVVAVEGSADMADLARRNVAANGLQDKVTVLCMMSTDLEPEDLPAKPDILVSEILGTLLLGESAHDYIEDVRRRILKPSTRIIPQHGVQYVVPIECKTLESITQVDKWDKLDLTHVNAIKDTASTVFTKKYGFRLSSVPFKKLSAPIPVVTVDFATSRGRRDIRRSQKFTVTPTDSGVCHAMLLYWEAKDDGLVMSTDPDATRDNFPRDMQWGQALQLVDAANEPLPTPFLTTAEQPFSVRCRASDDGVLLQFTLSHGETTAAATEEAPVAAAKEIELDPEDAEDAHAPQQDAAAPLREQLPEE